MLQLVVVVGVSGHTSCVCGLLCCVEVDIFYVGTLSSLCISPPALHYLYYIFLYNSIHSIPLHVYVYGCFDCYEMSTILSIKQVLNFCDGHSNLKFCERKLGLIHSISINNFPPPLPKILQNNILHWPWNVHTALFTWNRVGFIDLIQLEFP